MAQTAPDTVIVAEDEAAVYLQATTMAGWGPRGQPLLVRCDPSRGKTNFYGTLNLHTGQAVVTQADSMQAEATAKHLRAILSAHPDVPILLLWDRAPWQRGPAMREVLAANPRLEIMVLPTAAPDLNPQEQVWQATRRAVSHTHSQPRLPELAQRFEQHLHATTFQSSFLTKYGWTLVCPRST
ncbi:MAG: IS630 family transposase [Chloroflexota bacterium]|nr:IS630 family transposase [Chloroflexota bacterium]